MARAALSMMCFKGLSLEPRRTSISELLECIYDTRMNTWDLGPGTWDLGPGTWDLGLGTWDLGPGTWDLVRLAVGKRLLPNNKIGLDGCLLGLLDRYPLG